MNDKQLAESIKIDRVRYKYRQLTQDIITLAMTGKALTDKQRKVLQIAYNQSLGISPRKIWNHYRNLSPIGGYR